VIGKSANFDNLLHLYPAPLELLSSGAIQTRLLLLLSLFFDPGTQFPRNEKITLCIIIIIIFIIIFTPVLSSQGMKKYAMLCKKVQKSSWNEPYSSSKMCHVILATPTWETVSHQKC